VGIALLMIYLGTCGCNSASSKQVQEIASKQDLSIATEQDIKDMVGNVVSLSSQIASTVNSALSSSQTVQIEQPSMLLELAGLFVAIALFYLAAQYVKAKRRK